ncbi:MAG: ABC transporter permease [Firmicutes bacterium]|nr:ABC transporter permease [Bacillota bacterium]
MRVIDIIIKDLRVLLRDKKTIGIMIIMPIILITILGSALGNVFGGQDNTDKIQIAIVKEYNEVEEAEMFVESLKNNTVFQGIDQENIKDISENLKDFSMEEIIFNEFLKNEEIKEIIEYRVTNLDSAKDLLSNDEISAIVIFPENFAFDMYTNFATPFRNEVSIQILEHPEGYIDNQIVEGIFKGFTDKVSTMVIGKNVFIETMMENGFQLEALNKMDMIMESMSDILDSSSIALKEVNVNKNEPLSGFQYYTIAITSMFILFVAGEGAKLLLEEKDNLTYQRMAIAGTQKSKIVIGKFCTILVFALLQIGIMIAYSAVVLGVEWGNPSLVVLITLCAGFTMAGLGTVLAAVSYRIGNYKMADVFQGFIFIFAIFGGSFMPVDVLPSFIKPLSNFVPNGLTLKLYQKVMLGSGMNDILIYLIVLLAMAVGFTLIAVFILNGEERWKYVKYNNAKTSKIKS